MLTPSSNTVLEPVTTAMVSSLPEVSVHFGRFRVTEIALSGQALGQFNLEEILRAAELLSHAKMHVIGWNGTSSGWLGFETDERLCAEIARKTGAKACTSILALNELLKKKNVKRLGLVSPYLDDVQAKIVANYAKAGVECVAERHLGIQDNYSFSEVTADQLRAMCREVAKAKPEAIAIYCTNLRGAPLAQELEAELKIPILDSISTVVWKALKLAGVDASRVGGWGQLFKA
jgi:maleate isomerase